MRRLLPVLLVLLVPLSPALSARHEVSIRAYINVSSGCQAATVSFLNDLVRRYAPNVKLQTIDFGDEGPGLAAWRRSGHRCMTIELNGSALVKFPYGGKEVAVGFRMPAGLNWTHADLQHAVQAGLRGELQPASEAEVAGRQPARQVAATVTTSPAVRNGVPAVAVIINGRTAVLVPGGARASRAASAAAALRAWLAAPVKPSELSARQTSAGYVLSAAGRKIITATPADAKSFGLQPQALAEWWSNGIKHALSGTQK